MVFFLDLSLSMKTVFANDAPPHGVIHDDVIKWRHFPVLLALCEVNSPVTGGFPSQRPMRRSFGIFFDVHPKKMHCAHYDVTVMFR